MKSTFALGVTYTFDKSHISFPPKYNSVSKRKGKESSHFTLHVSVFYSHFRFLPDAHRDFASFVYTGMNYAEGICLLSVKEHFQQFGGLE